MRIDATQQIDAHLTANPGMSIDTTFLRNCIDKLEASVDAISQRHTEDEITDHLYRDVCVQQFERVMEQSGKLLRKRLTAFFSSNLPVDRLTFRDLFRHAARHGLITADASERWLNYRNNRNDPTHNDSDGFADVTLKLLPGLIADARGLTHMIDEASND